MIWLRPRIPVALRGLAAAICILGVAGCSKKEATAEKSSSTPQEKRWPLTGVVIAVNPERRTLTVQHEEIKGYMPGMTMEFRVNSGDLALAQPGRKLHADFIERQPDLWLEKIWWDDPVGERTIAAAANALKQDTVIRGTKAYREVGENLPDAALYDQEGRVVQFNRFRGKQVVLNFIYSRCPIANMCPASTAKMMALQEGAKKATIRDFELISVTLDPEYDTPGVLKEYASVRGIDTSNFSFLTGPEAAIKDLLTQLGVIAEFKDGILNHTLSTLLINEDGKIVHREDGSAWQVDTFLKRLQKS